MLRGFFYVETEEKRIVRKYIQKMKDRRLGFLFEMFLVKNNLIMGGRTFLKLFCFLYKKMDCLKFVSVII